MGLLTQTERRGRSRVQPQSAGLLTAGRRVRGLLSDAAEWAGNNPLDAAALATSPIPIFGDVVGGVADAVGLYENPTWTNAGLAAIGLLPFVPGGMTKMIPPEVGRYLAESQKFTNRNPRKLVNSGVREGVIPENVRDEAVVLAEEIRSKQLDRKVSRPVRDPLLANRALRERKVEKLKSVKSVDSTPISTAWNANMRDRVHEAARRGFADGVEREARLATVEALTREARKRGLEVRHTSKEGGRVTSRYIKTPDGREVRISDHYLPMTPRREMSSTRWDREIIVDDWRNRSLEDYFNEILSPNWDDLE